MVDNFDTGFTSVPLNSICSPASTAAAVVGGVARISQPVTATQSLVSSGYFSDGGFDPLKVNNLNFPVYKMQGQHARVSAPSSRTRKFKFYEVLIVLLRLCFYDAFSYEIFRLRPWRVLSHFLNFQKNFKTQDSRVGLQDAPYGPS